ncbi:hypothetical protein [Marilutibacter alkalisoli]|uniref:hypothetical protein n=1 Tax=Marilutibacter alkalisoli TaxID=2591633 RepID=UPI00141E69AE|nr:hypothetical protein [Lysobacter alkalisoli]
MGDALAMSLEDLNTPEDLPQLLELACSTIKDVRGKQTAERFRQVVGLAGS